MDFNKFYNKHYKQLVFVPLIFLVFAIAIIGNTYVQTGDFVQKDVSLQGGTIVTISSPQDFTDLENVLETKFPESDVLVRGLSEFGTNQKVGTIIEATKLKSEDIETVLEEEYGLEIIPGMISVEESAPTLGESFYKQMLVAIGLAFLFMSIVVFLIFRSFIPSLAVVLTALTDILTTVAIIDLMGIRLSTSGIAALLMLIGYSIDTDMLLTTKVLKRTEGSTISRVKKAMTTGLTMTFTTIVALSVALPVTQSPVLKQMFTIIIIGLSIDVFLTYCFNAGILIWYQKKKHGN